MLPIELIHLVCANLNLQQVARLALAFSPVYRRRLLACFQVGEVAESDLKRGLHVLARSYFYRHDHKTDAVTPLMNINDIHFRLTLSQLSKIDHLKHNFQNTLHT